MLRVILDFDGTLTAEEKQSAELARLSTHTLANDILHISAEDIGRLYNRTQERLLAHPRDYAWKVNGLIASYCNEGSFILNTTTLQTMLSENRDYYRAVQAAFPNPEYDAVADCTNYLFHKHTPALTPEFRPHALETLTELQAKADMEPLILTNSLGDKVAHFLENTHLSKTPRILGDTRQYEMAPEWQMPTCTELSVTFVPGYPVDLRRPAYYDALVRESQNDVHLMVVADTFSMPGALPLMMGIPFILIHTAYTPDWCVQAVSDHPLGYVIQDLVEIIAIAESLC